MTQASPRVWLSEWHRTQYDIGILLTGRISVLNIVTGTSTGFGRDLTEYLLAKDEVVIATARRPSLLDDLVAKYSKDRLLPVSLDGP